MIDSVAFTHLKCFDTLRVELAPLTLLTGFNAAGKSTSYQPILLVAQALRTAPGSELLGLNGPLVKLGTAGEVLASGIDNSPAKISIDANGTSITWDLRPAPRSGGSGALIVESGSLSTADEKPISWTRRLLPQGTISPGGEALLATIRDVIYVSASRLGTSEVFPSPDDSGVSHADVGPRGEYAPWWYAQFADEEIASDRRHKDEEGLTLRRQLDAFLSDIFPGGQANAEVIPRTSFVHLGLRSDIKSDWRRPINTGYGMSYVFPALVALLLAKPHQTVIIDSPEAHLHPRGQSIMGRHLAHFSNAGVQIIIETHSDHILNGIRCATRESIINPDKIAIYFFASPDNEKHQQRVQNLRVDGAGNINNWPQGFFDQAERDLANIAGWD